MKLYDCDCGGIPQVIYEISNKLKYAVICESCGNQTPVCKTVREAVALWNQTYYRALPSYEIKSA